MYSCDSKTIMNNTKNMDARTAKLHQIMKDNGLKAVDVASMLGRKVITIRIWRCASDNRIIPADALKVLELTMAEKSSK